MQEFPTLHLVRYMPSNLAQLSRTIEAYRFSLALNELGYSYRFGHAIQIFLKDAVSTGSMALIDETQLLGSRSPI